MGETSPERIWLLPNAGNDGETLWCDDPAPGEGMDEADAIEYTRSDSIPEALIEAEKRGAERMRERAANLYNTGGPGFGNEWDTFASFNDALCALPLTEETPDADA